MIVHSVGVDVGGTWLRAAAADRGRRIVWRSRSPAPPVSRLPGALERLLKSRRAGRPETLIVASRGVWTGAERARLRRRLRPLSKSVTVLSDVELAFESALTPSLEPPGRQSGVLLVAGTGSIAMGRDRRGRVVRVGGLAQPSGDPGSGHWIGREFLKGAPPSLGEEGKVGYRKRFGLRTPSQPSPKEGRGFRSIASLAPLVLRKARRDPVCRVIVSKAQSSLAGMAVRVAQELGWRGMVRVSWSGGLFEDDFFRGGVLTLLRMVRGLFRFQTNPPRRAPADAAARWGERLPERLSRRRPIRK